MNVSKIRDVIDEKGLVHHKLAKRIGVHPNTLSSFLTGKTMLGAEALIELLAELNLSARSLIKKDAA